MEVWSLASRNAKVVREMSTRFEELVAHSGSSQLLGYEFAEGVLTIHLDIDALDGLYAISIPTNFVYGEKLSAERSDLRNCRLDLIDLREILDVERGVYSNAQRGALWGLSCLWQVLYRV
jgi:hypothetical protein